MICLAKFVRTRMRHRTRERRLQKQRELSPVNLPSPFYRRYLQNFGQGERITMLRTSVGEKVVIARSRKNSGKLFQQANAQVKCAGRRKSYGNACPKSLRLVFNEKCITGISKDWNYFLVKLYRNFSYSNLTFLI